MIVRNVKFDMPVLIPIKIPTAGVAAIGTGVIEFRRRNKRKVVKKSRRQ